MLRAAALLTVLGLLSLSARRRRPALCAAAREQAGKPYAVYRAVLVGTVLKELSAEDRTRLAATPASSFAHTETRQ